MANREVMVPLLSRLDLGSSFYVFCGLWPMYFFFHIVFLVTLDLVLVLFGIMVCPRISFYNSWISLGSESLSHISARIIILRDVSFK